MGMLFKATVVFAITLAPQVTVAGDGANPPRKTAIMHVCYFGCHDEMLVASPNETCAAVINQAEKKYWRVDMPATRVHYTFECR
jgi:hypothetical protein